MLAPVSFLAKVKNDLDTTYYFYSKETGMLFPLEIQEVLENSMHPQEMLTKVLNAFNLHVLALEIYEYIDGVFYFYMGVKDLSDFKEININLEEFLQILCTFHPQVYVETHVLSECGLYVTKENLLNLDNFEC